MKPAMNKMPRVPRKRTIDQMSKEPSPPLASTTKVSTPRPSTEKYVKIPEAVYEKMAQSYYKNLFDEKKKPESEHKEDTLEDAMFKLNYELNAMNYKQQKALQKANLVVKDQEARIKQLEKESKDQKGLQEKIIGLEKELKDQKELQLKVQQCNLLRHLIMDMENNKLTKYNLLILYYDGELKVDEWNRIDTEFPRPITSQIAIDQHDYLIKRYKTLKKVLRACKCLDDETTCDGCRQIRERFNNEMIEHKGRPVRWGFTSELQFISETDNEDFEDECIYA